MFIFDANQFFYLTIILSNCTYQGSTFLTPMALFSLEKTIKENFKEISGLEFRGVGCSMVRGDINSLTLGISAGYFYHKQGLNNTDAEILRSNIFGEISSINGLSFSEIRIETTLTGKI